MVQKIYFMRHGTCEYNPEIYWSQDRIHLSEQGRLDVSVVAKNLITTKLDAVFVSPFTRTIETAKIVSSYIKMEYSVFNGLEERHLFSLDNLERKKIATTYPEEYTQMLKNNIDNINLAGEETLEESQNRVVGILNDILNKDLESALIISHGGPHAWLCCHFLNLPIACNRVFNLDPANLSVFVFSDKQFMRIHSLNTCGL